MPQGFRYIGQEVSGLADALILATARCNALDILTSDHHFADLPNVTLLEK